jgi:hypothetical protein
MLGNAVRPAGQTPCQKDQGIEEDAEGTANIVVTEAPAPKPGLMTRLKRLFAR